MEVITTSSPFFLNKKAILDKTLLKSDYYSYRPPTMTAINTRGTILTIDIPKLDVPITLEDAYLEGEISVVKAADNTRYADGDGIQLVSNALQSLFDEISLKNSSNQTIDPPISYSAGLMLRMLKSSDEEMMSNFRKDDVDGVIETTKRDRLLNDTPEKGTIFLRSYLRDFGLGFPASQDTITINQGFKLILKRAETYNSIFRTIADNAKVEIKDLVLYVRQFTPSIDNMNLINEHILANKSAVYPFTQNSYTTKPINANRKWTFEIGQETSIDIPLQIIVGFQSIERLQSQTQNNGVFDQLNITSAQCRIGTDRYPDQPYTLDYTRNKYNDAYEAVRNYYYDFMEGKSSPYLTFKDLKTLYPFLLFDLRAQKEYLASQPIYIDIEFAEGFDAVGGDYMGIAVSSSRKVLSVSSDGKQQFELI